MDDSTELFIERITKEKWNTYFIYNLEGSAKSHGSCRIDIGDKGFKGFLENSLEIADWNQSKSLINIQIREAEGEQHVALKISGRIEKFVKFQFGLVFDQEIEDIAGLTVAGSTKCDVSTPYSKQLQIRKNYYIYEHVICCKVR